jgi:E3 ubiquitin-protein ligase listerin
VQENYASNIREYGYLNTLLDFAFGFLEKSRGKLLDATKINIRSYETGLADSRQADIEWLLVHLYFLAAKHLATLTKAWWIDSKKRIKGPVEVWTAKYVRLFHLAFTASRGYILTILSDIATRYRRLLE